MDRWRRCRMLTGMAAMVAVAGCGGGGGSAGASPFGATPSPSPSPSPSPAPAASAEGLWVGSTSLGFDLTLLVLETGDSWAVYRSATGIAGVVHAQQSWDGSTVQGNGFDYSVANRARFTAGLSARYTAKGTQDGTLTSNAVPSTYTTTYSTDYDQPATTAAIAGTWSLSAFTLAGATTATVQLAPEGTFAGTDPNCTSSGALAPRSGNRNAYTLTATFAGAACPFDGETLTGVATLVSDGTLRRLTLLALPADAGDGWFASGAR